MLNWALPSALCLIPYLNTQVYISIISFQNSFVIVPACSFVIIHFSSKNSDINVIIMLSTDLFTSFIYFKESCLLLFFFREGFNHFQRTIWLVWLQQTTGILWVQTEPPLTELSYTCMLPILQTLFDKKAAYHLYVNKHDKASIKFVRCFVLSSEFDKR